MTFEQKAEDPRPPLVLYEDLPPKTAKTGDMVAKVRRLSAILSRSHVDAVNIPEIRLEQSRGPKPVGALPKIDPLTYGSWCTRIGGVPSIVYRCVPYHEKQVHVDWCKRALEMGIRAVVVVGRESSVDDCPGPEAGEAITLFKSLGMVVGGVMIPHRENEEQRMVAKVEAGASFFVTQILFSQEDVGPLLVRYSALCAKSGVDPKRVVLSFAPVTSERNLKFMEWLGVQLHPCFREDLLRFPASMVQRSRLEAMKALTRLFEGPIPSDVPLGLNIEHVMDQNTAAALDLLQEMSEIYRLQWMARGADLL